jgi:hypothetical protein
LKLLYRWHEEPSLEEMKHAESPLHNMINLELINTPPEKLRALAEAKIARENGSRETVRKDRGDGTLSAQREQPPAAGEGQHGSKKEAPFSPIKQPEQASREVTLERVAQADRPVDPLAGNPPSPPRVQSREGSERPLGWHEHRQACRLKFG